MKVIKDFLPKNDFEILKKTVIKDIPWYFNDETNPGPKQLNDFYFCHTLFDCHPISTFYQLFLDKLISKIGMFALRRAKLNCYPWSENIVEHKLHADYPIKHKAFILYFNTCNGFTIFEDGSKIDTVENTALLFDGSQKHRSTNCTNDKARFNININYL